MSERVWNTIIRIIQNIFMNVEFKILQNKRRRYREYYTQKRVLFLRNAVDYAKIMKFLKKNLQKALALFF